jgi:crotonobetainyl-CoA:carnitine CoA-transferase CaiB-like acyl-CoA transferase
MALLDSLTGVLANQALFHLVSGTPPKRMGNAHPAVVPYQTFPCSDGHVLIACGNDGQFVKMMAILGDPSMSKDERYATNPARIINRGTLIPRLNELTVRFTRAQLTAEFEKAGVPAGPINTIADAFADPQVIARGMRIDLPHPQAKGGTIPGVRSPMTINGRRAFAERAQPMVGEHTDEILREIGEA